ncbi:MAG: type IV toxin-antitoxin system AbiEi family antitoxin domain-containing protein [Steroidobacteraceae bacterium]
MAGRRVYSLRYNRAAAHAAQRLRAAGIVGFFRLQQLTRAGLTRDQLPTLIRRHVVERVSRGLYHIVGATPHLHDSLAMVCARAPDSVVCMLSALHLHGIASVAPPQVWLGIPHGTRRPRLQELNAHIIRFSGAAWSYGIDGTDIDGVPARITSPARTVADCCRLAPLLGTQVAVTAFREALARRIVSYTELARAQEALPSRRLHALLQML